VAVVAGTAADASRVAYVKTVRPSSLEADERPTSEMQSDVQPRYTNEVQCVSILQDSRPTNHVQAE